MIYNLTLMLLQENLMLVARTVHILQSHMESV